MWAEALDLLIGSRCAGCAEPGPTWCPQCVAEVRPHPWVAWPEPVPPGLVMPVAAVPYVGAIRGLIIAHKELNRFAARTALGEFLAAAVDVAAPRPGPLIVIPVPSRPGVSRRRGYDPTRALTSSAVRTLRRLGREATMLPVLRSRGAPADQGGLDAVARARNVAESLWVPGDQQRRLQRQVAGTGGRWQAVICDDVLTTGATALEAQRALTAIGLVPDAIATVAASVRRHRSARSF